MSQKRKLDLSVVIRNFTFGVEDSLVSTVGLLSGLAVTSISQRSLIMTGCVLIFVEAFSMAAGSFLSEDTTEEFIEQKSVEKTNSIMAAFIMFFSYFISGFIPILPYIFFFSSSAIYISIFVSIFFLFILGMFAGKVSKLSLWKNGLKMAGVGGMAILVGIIIGSLVDKIA